MFLLCYDKTWTIISPQNKSQKNLLIFDVPHMEFFLNLNYKKFLLEGVNELAHADMVDFQSLAMRLIL